VSSVLNIKTRQTLKGRKSHSCCSLFRVIFSFFFVLFFLFFFNPTLDQICTLFSGRFYSCSLLGISPDAQEVSDKIMLEFSCVHLFSSMYFFKHFHFIHLILHLFVQFACPLFSVVSQSCIFFSFSVSCSCAPLESRSTLHAYGSLLLPYML